MLETTFVLCRGVAKLVKAPDFDSGIRRFESFHPCQIFRFADGIPCERSARRLFSEWDGLVFVQTVLSRWLQALFNRLALSLFAVLYLLR